MIVVMTKGIETKFKGMLVNLPPYFMIPIFGTFISLEIFARDCNQFFWIDVFPVGPKTGPGVPKDNFSYFFLPFFQVMLCHNAILHVGQHHTVSTFSLDPTLITYILHQLS